jgi:hypothetical protein
MYLYLYIFSLTVSTIWSASAELSHARDSSNSLCKASCQLTRHRQSVRIHDDQVGSFFFYLNSDDVHKSSVGLVHVRGGLNNKSARDHPGFVSEAIFKLLEGGYITEQAEPPYCINSLSVI